jgi:hypothetical protein
MGSSGPFSTLLHAEVEEKRIGLAVATASLREAGTTKEERTRLENMVASMMEDNNKDQTRGRQFCGAVGLVVVGYVTNSASLHKSREKRRLPNQVRATGAFRKREAFFFGCTSKSFAGLCRCSLLSCPI